jgi:hypothetical protein
MGDQRSVAEKPVLFVAHRAIAAATRGRQPIRIPNHDAPAFFIDQSRAMQGADHDCDRRPMDAEGRREQFVSEWDIVLRNQVADGEQPSNTALFDRMEHIARRHLHASREEQLPKASNRRVQGFVRKQLPSQYVGTDPHGQARDQNDPIARHRRDTGENCGPGKTVAADETDVQRLARLEPKHERHDGPAREIRHREWFVCSKQHVFPREAHWFEVRLQATGDGCWK